VWTILAGKTSLDIIIIGVFASLLTTLLFSDMLFRLSNRKTSWLNYVRNSFYFFLFIPVFFYEALISALKVSRHTFERSPSFSPGIIKVKTSLTNVSAISLLANLITLTPGTLTLDFDKAERAFYIHWIDVTTRKKAEKKKEVIGRFESWLEVIFQ
jgi:multicomponent Na+:H+ antiporter subunit E